MEDTLRNVKILLCICSTVSSRGGGSMQEEEKPLQNVSSCGQRQSKVKTSNVVRQSRETRDMYIPNSEVASASCKGFRRLHPPNREKVVNNVRDVFWCTHLAFVLTAPPPLLLYFLGSLRLILVLSLVPLPPSQKPPLCLPTKMI